MASPKRRITEYKLKKDSNKNIFILWLFFPETDILIINLIQLLVISYYVLCLIDGATSVCLVFFDSILFQVGDWLHEDMKKKLDEYVTDIERVTKTWDWVQQKVFALIQS